MILNRLLTALVVGFTTLGAIAGANGAVTTNGDLYLESAGNPTPLEDIKRLSGALGRIYTNTVGTEIRTISVDVIQSATNGFESPATLPNGSNLIAITALRGTIVGFDVGGLPIVSFDVGTLFLQAQPAAGFDPRNPSSWGFTAANVFAQYALGAPEAIIPGPNGELIGPFPASIINLSSPVVASPTQSEARLLFWEDSTAAQNAGATPGLGAGTGGDNFLHNVDGGFVADGLFVTAQQTIENIALSGFGYDAADLALLNLIYSTAGLGEWASELGAGTNGDGWDPAGTGSGFNGDFRAQLNTESHIVGAIPEPISMLTWAGLAGIGGVLTLRGRRKMASA
jgi:hypothetical protein